MARSAALLVAALLLAPGCADLVEFQYDPIGDVRPSTLVRRLQEEIADFRATWEPQRKGGYGPVDYQLGELAKATNAMAADLSTKAGRFPAELEKARVAGFAIVNQLAGRTSRSVQESWRPLRDTLNTLLTEYRGVDAASVYAREAVPTRTVSPIPSPPEDYDASFSVDRVQTGFATCMKAWEESAARRTQAPWTKALDRELAGFSSGLGDLARVKSGRRAEVVPVATRLSAQGDRVAAILRDRAKDLPPRMADDWSTTQGWLKDLTK